MPPRSRGDQSRTPPLDVASYFERAEYHFYHASRWPHSAMRPRRRSEPSTEDVGRPPPPPTGVGRELPGELCEPRSAGPAEIAHLEDRELDAERLYEQAIRLARDNGFIQNEALAYELAARFYAARGFEKIARAYLQDARRGYLRWGADGKVRQLDQLYPQLRTEEQGSSLAGTIGTPRRTPRPRDRDQGVPSYLERDGPGKAARYPDAHRHRARRCRARAAHCFARE